MPLTIPKADLRPAALPVLDQVSQGDYAVITEYNRPIAEVHPLGTADRLKESASMSSPTHSRANAEELLAAYLETFKGDRKRIRHQLRREIDARLSALDLLDESASPTPPVEPK